jgi:hypothetical protein
LFRLSTPAFAELVDVEPLADPAPVVALVVFDPLLVAAAKAALVGATAVLVMADPQMMMSRPPAL